MKKLLICALALALTSTAAFAEFGMLGGLGYTMSIVSFDSGGTTDYSAKGPAVFALIHGNKKGNPTGWYASVCYTSPSEFTQDYNGTSVTVDDPDTSFGMNTNLGISVASPHDSMFFYLLGAGLGLDITSLTYSTFEVSYFTAGLGLDAVGGIKVLPAVTVFAAIRDTYCPVTLAASLNGIDWSSVLTYSNSLNISVGAGLEF